VTRRRGFFGWVLVGVVSLLAVGGVAGAIAAGVDRHWRELAAGLPDLALWLWWTFSFWHRDGRFVVASDQSSTSDADLGWPTNLVTVVKLLPRGFAPLGARRSGGDLLLGLRAVTVAFSAALVLIAGVLARLSGTPNGLPNGPVWPWVPIVVVLAMPNLFVERMYAARRLDASTPSKLAAAYRAQFMLRLAYATTIALFAFTITFVGGPAWIYYPAVAVALVRIWTGVAPTAAVLARDQRRLQAKGIDMPLVGALRGAGC
jgi:hypothetical protein